LYSLFNPASLELVSNPNRLGGQPALQRPSDMIVAGLCVAQFLDGRFEV
jgi:hypothetical protein